MKRIRNTGINIYVSSIIVIKINFSESALIKRGYVKTKCYGVLCWDLWGGTHITINDQLSDGIWNFQKAGTFNKNFKSSFFVTFVVKTKNADFRLIVTTKAAKSNKPQNVRDARLSTVLEMSNSIRKFAIYCNLCARP